jgi:hypothetical protein
VAQVFAGFVAGYGLALISTPLFSIFLLRLRAGSATVARILPPDVPVVGVSVLLHGALVLFWTGVGLVLGIILFAMRDADGAVGSLNGPFTLLVASLVLAVAAPLVALAAALRQIVIISALLALLIYGWLMPYLAEWSKFS